MDGSYPISPWTDSADRTSPDGRYRAVIRQAVEVGMGAPTRGEEVVSENVPGGRILFRLESCSPSFVWASDSKALAVPQWTTDRQQRLSIVSVPSGTLRSLPDAFRVLSLHAFEDGVVRGVDSPVYRPRSFMAPVEDLIEP